MTKRHLLFAFSIFSVLALVSVRAFGDFAQYPGAFGNLQTLGTNKLGASGTAFHNMGICTVASTTITTTAATHACMGVPASAAVAVACTGAAAFSTSTGNGLYCQATGTANQVACNTILANTTAMAYSCVWVQP